MEFEQPENIDQSKSGDSLYSKFSEIKPSRVEETESSQPKFDDGGGSLTQRMKFSPKMTDTQVVDKRLFPILKETLDWLNNLMVARVFPETLNPLRNIIVKHLLHTNPDMSFAEAISLAEVALTVAIDGEGRMDIIHLFSKMGDTENTEEKKNIL